MSKDFDIVNMDDRKAEKFAEAVRNPTSKKIWSFLKKRSASQKDISQKLKIPMPTVHYNLERLIAAGLVEIEDYYWSPKGNKVHMYRASKKVMVFTPNKMPYLEQHMKAILGIAVVFIAILALVAFQGVLITDDNKGPIIDANINKNLQTFSSDKEFLGVLKNVRESSSNSGRINERTTFDSATPTAASASSGSSKVDFSTTNIQIKGVDEADILKSDGEYMYLVSQGKFVIVKAYPAKEAQVLVKKDLGNFYPSELFIDGDRVLLFGSEIPRDAYKMDAIMPGFLPGGEFMQVRTFDITDRSNPKQIRTVEFEGSYLTSRKVGDYVYFVVNTYPYYESLDACDSVVPLFADVKGREPTKSDREVIAPCTEIGYTNPVHVESFITVAAISISDEDEAVRKETILGNAQAVYASKENLYIAQALYPSWGGLPVPVPLAEAEVSEGQADSQIGKPVEVVVEDRDAQKPTTVITKFSIGKGDISFETTATVPGHVLNQFSMDEFDGHFRIATTVREWSRSEEKTSNNLYILDEELKQVGSIANIAPGEQIFSARFMGEKIYLVTFEQVDPLFVIDASNPSNPKILGKLKIPGFSNYLHPIGDKYLLGIGQEVEETKDNRFVTTGVKLAIFDVSDVENPEEVHKEVIGERFSSTLAQYDHRAVLFDEEKGLFVLPITVTEKENKDEHYYPTVFQGAYVFDLNVKNGFKLRGKISHYTADEEKKFGDYYYGFEILRSAYIGDVLYTLSSSRLQLNDLDSLKRLKALQIADQQRQWYEFDDVRGSEGIAGEVIVVESVNSKTDSVPGQSVI